MQFIIVTEQMLGLAVSEFEWIQRGSEKNPGWFSSSLTVTSLVAGFMALGFNEKGRLGFWTWEMLVCGRRCADREWVGNVLHMLRNLQSDSKPQKVNRKASKVLNSLTHIIIWQGKLGLFLVHGASRTSFQAAHQHAFPESGNWFPQFNPDSFSDLQLPTKCIVFNDCLYLICKIQKSGRGGN